MTGRSGSTDIVPLRDEMAKANHLTTQRLQELARTGPQVTLERLRAEVSAIEQAFPELAAIPRNRQAVQRSVKMATQRSRRCLLPRARPFPAHDTVLGRTQEGPRKAEVEILAILRQTEWADAPSQRRRSHFLR